MIKATKMDHEIQKLQRRYLTEPIDANLRLLNDSLRRINKIALPSYRALLGLYDWVDNEWEFTYRYYWSLWSTNKDQMLIISASNIKILDSNHLRYKENEADFEIYQKNNVFYGPEGIYLLLEVETQLKITNAPQKLTPNFDWRKPWRPSYA